MKFYLALFSLFYASVFLAQENDFGFEVKAKYGFLIAHRPMMNHLPVEHTQAIEGTIFFQTKGKKDWHNVYKFPKIGFSLLYASVGNDEILGKFLGGYSFLDYPFINGKKNKLYGKIACGLGYAFKVFDQQENPKNIAISSHLNALINFGLHYQRFFKKSHISLGIDLTHFSNGAVKMPNLGLNLPYLALAYGREISNKEEKNAYEKINFHQKRPWKFSIIATFSFKDSYPTGMPKSKIFALNFSTQKVFKLRKGYEVGFDFIHKPSTAYYKPLIDKSHESMIQIGFYNAYVLTLQKLQMVVGMGVYIKDDYFPDDRFYHRVGLRYTINEKFIVNFTLKSHFAKADYVEYGIGYRL